MAGGYDISASLSAASSAAANNSGGFSVQGGSKSTFSWQSALVLSLAALAGLFLFIKSRRSA